MSGRRKGGWTRTKAVSGISVRNDERFKGFLNFRHFSQGGDVEKLRTQLGDKVADAFDRNSMRGEKR